MPLQVIYALALVKKCSAKANEQLGLLSSKKSKAISQSADEICRGKWDDHFPLPVWQTGSGTASNMNVNEVIANRSIQILNNQLGDKSVHPNDDVNKCQSSNDVFPTAMHISAVGIVQSSFLPAIRQFITSLDQKISEFSDVVKVGRTHLMDAVPLTLGQEFSGYRAQLISNCERLKKLFIASILSTFRRDSCRNGFECSSKFCKTYDFLDCQRKWLPLSTSRAVIFHNFCPR